MNTHRLSSLRMLLCGVVLVASSLLAGCGASFEAGGSPDSITSTDSSTSSSSAAGSGGADEGGDGGAGGALVPERSITTWDDRGHALPNVPLVVYDASGAVVKTSQTDLGGQRSIAIPPGGSISAFYADGADLQIISFLDPPKGSIAFGFTRAVQANPPADATTYTLTASQLPAEATALECFTPCGWAKGSVALATCTISTAGCAYDSFTDLLVVAYDGDEPIAWGASLHQPTSPGGTVNLSVPLFGLTMPLGATINEVPPDATQVKVHADSRLSPALWLPVQFLTDQPGPAMAPSLTVLAGTALGVHVHEEIRVATVSSASMIVRDREYVKAPPATSFSAASMARVSVSPLDVHDPSHPVVSWNVGTGARGDVGAVELRWFGGATTGRYTAYFAPDAPTTFRVPDVPAELDSFLPQASSTFAVVAASYADHEALDGYAEVMLRAANPNLMVKEDGLGTVATFGATSEITN